MTVWYVGKGGHDGNSGRSWDTRLATLNGAEDQPVVAGDTVYVGPGAYRETLTCDVSGASGKPITYIGDVTGEHTDGVGGIVRITGSDNDQTQTRNDCIDGSGEDYRTFRGFTLDMCSVSAFKLDASETNWIIEDCVLKEYGTFAIHCFGDSQADYIIRRCLFMPGAINFAVTFVSAGGIQDAGHLIENCIFKSWRGVSIEEVGGIDFRNCSFYGQDRAIRITDALPVGYTAINVNNSIFQACNIALQAQALGEIVENYNTFYECVTARTNINVGGNSETHPALMQPPLLHAGTNQRSGYKFPWWSGELSKWSQVKQITGTGEPEEDLLGIKRPYTHGGPVASLCSWGAVQYHDYGRSIIRAYDGTQSAKIHEKNRTWMFVPSVSNVQTTITARVYRTAGYGGHRKPAMVIKQPGQADRLTEDVGAAGAWNQLSDTFTPAAQPPWLAVELVNYCDFTTTTTTTVSTTSTTTTSTTTQTVTTTSTTSTTLACDVWFDAIRVT